MIIYYREYYIKKLKPSRYNNMFKCKFLVCIEGNRYKLKFNVYGFEKVMDDLKEWVVLLYRIEDFTLQKITSKIEETLY